MLAMCLKTRYQSKGEPKDLDDCIRLFHLAISFPSLAQEDTISMFNNYGLTLRLRYKRTRNLDDLDLAAGYLEKALSHMGDLRSRLSALNNLLLIFQDRHATTGEMEDIRLAIRYGEEALSSADQTENRIKSGILINLANALTATGDPSDLDRAVEYARKAVALDTAMQSGHQAPLLRSDASDVLLTRYKAKQQDDDLRSALAFSEEASKLIRQGHSAQGSVLLQLGVCLSAGDPSKIPWRRVVGVYTDAWQCASSLPVNRIFAASKAATILTANNCFTEAADLLERAVKLMPTIDSRWTKRTDLEGLTAASLALPADAAMVALKAGSSAETALSLLEMGRGRTLRSLLDLRTEVSSSEDPDGLIRSFNLLRMKADAARTPSVENEFRQQTAKLLMDIRQRPGLENFMYPPTPKDYMKQAAAGPIVVATTSAMVDTGMAIIITSSRIYSLPLINLTHAETTKQLREMSEEVTSGEFETYPSRNKKMLGLLGWLWDVIAKPVIENLRLSKQLDAEKLPHIHWIGIGLLATAPLHVAGEYGVTGASESTMDYAVSSYAPSLRALLYAAERSPREYLNKRKDTRVLIVKMSETDGASPLQNVEEEAATLKGLAQSVSMQTTELNAPTTSDVLSHLPLHNTVHFACHGVSDPGDPSKTHLLLSDGALSVEKILKTHSAAPDVAFLSACSTAESHDARVVDESIHIASAFMMVGFKHIIGTLWEGSDKACMVISNRFYAKLFEEDEQSWDGSWKVALALHHAVRQVQGLHPKYPLLWAPFVAFGP
ncbi:hypothetical protein CVT26_004117 [Gymnopilus dilepis]|uniref:CHAT domain-containing protein n=1 Tax=Gymnopilus dilepis TaxID=231916 RepID=A0A409YVD1_9AGAR|nr:hypothetical protein CVT26_004117 [Gymnopilus dilepis]